MNNYLQETELQKGRKMRHLKNRLMALCILMVISTAGYAQSFSNVQVDVGSGDQSETSIAVRLSKSLAFGCGPSPRKKIAIDALTL